MKKNYKLITSALVAATIQLSVAQCPIPTSVTATPSVICVGATTSLNATAVGHSINWYTVPVGGTPLGTSLSGADFTINPVITNTYYAESVLIGTMNFSYTGSMQQYTVPAGVSQLTITAIGAAGGSLTANGSYTGGLGASMQGVFNVTPGQVLTIVVGGEGSSDPSSSGGGGASGVASGATPLIVAGGGAGVDFQDPNYSSRHAVITQNGEPGNGGVLGGTGGADGSDTNYSGNISWGGRGFNFNNAGSFGQDGLSINTTTTAGTWGIGGGGGSVGMGWCNCGAGGGGYSGGGSGDINNSGGGGGSFNSGTNQVNTVMIGAGQGTVIITAPGCVSVSRAGITVTVAPTPTISVNSGSICTSNSFTINPSGANTYTIQGGNAIVSPTTNTSYTVIGTSSFGCISNTFATSNVTVNAGALPTISVNGGTVCSGSNFTLNPSGANTYTFQGGSAVVNPITNTSYTVVGTNSLGCVSNSFATANITVTALPSLSVSGNGTICSGQSATLSLSGSANTYSWSTGPTTTSIIVSPSVTTNYTASGTSTVTGCTAINIINLVVSPCTGFNEVNSPLNGLMVYPNPTNGEFIVNLLNGLEKKILITDITGKVVYSLNSTNDKVKVDLKDLSNGVYFMKIDSNNASHTFKVVKQ